MQLPSHGSRCFSAGWCQLAGLTRRRLERMATWSFNSKRPLGGGCRTSLCRAEKGCHVSDEDCGKPRGAEEARSFPKARAELSVQRCNDTEKRQILRDKRRSFSRRRFCMVSESSQLSWEDQEFQLRSLDSRGARRAVEPENNGKSVVREVTRSSTQEHPRGSLEDTWSLVLINFYLFLPSRNREILVLKKQ